MKIKTIPNSKYEPSIQHERPSQRRLHRITAPLRLLIGDKYYQSQNWHVEGLSIIDFDGQHSLDDSLDIVVNLNFQGFNISFVQLIKVIRISKKDNSFAAVFVNLEYRQRDLLEYFTNHLITGEMVVVDDAIKRIDLPVTPPSPLPFNANHKVPVNRRHVNRIVISGIYLTIGFLVTGAILTTIYSHLFRIEIESAVVSAQVVAVESPASGKFIEIAYETNSMVKKGDTIGHIVNSKLQDELDNARLDVQKAELEVAEIRAKITVQLSELEIYKEIGSSRVNATKAGLQYLREDLVIKDNELVRISNLRKQGIATQSDVDAIEINVSNIKKQLEAANAEFAISKQAVNAISGGSFFTGNKLEGNVQELRSLLEIAIKRVAIEEKKLALLVSRLEGHSLKAAFDAKLVKVLKSGGNMVSHGEPVFLLERLEARYIDAFVTQAEVQRLSLNSEALVYIPAIDKYLNANVTDIDRTIGFTDSVQSQFKWRSADDRTAHVVLKFSLDNDMLNNSLPTGVPAVVTFKVFSGYQWLDNLIKVDPVVASSKVQTYAQ